MPERRPTIRIGIYGPDVAAGQKNSCNLWPAGVASCLTAADDSGYEIDEAEVIYWGRCPECVAATPAAPGG